MAFLFPLVLAGLAAISIPIAIHLLNKLQVRLVDWGAMRFLEESLRKNERRVKLEDLILLILRCLFVAMLVLAFARPVLRALAVGNADSTGPVTAVVILDNSASMMQGNSVETRFDKAKKEILKWLDSRESNSLTALYLVSNRTQAVISRPEADRGLFRKMLETARPGDRGTDLAQGIRLAYQTLETVGGRSREIRIYSDDQNSGWANLEEIRKLVQQHPDILLKPIVLSAAGENNRGVIGLRVDGGVPSAGQPCRMRVEVGNYGTEAAENIVVALAIDGAPAGETLLASIAPGTTQSADVVLNFPDAGPHAVTARIPPDGFATDNERATAVNVVRRMNVLIVEGGTRGDLPADRDGYFLANALVPLPPDRAAQYYLATSFTTESELNPQTLADCQAVFFSNPGALSPETARLMQDFVAKGGNVVVFPGPLTDPDQWKQNTSWADLMPVTLGPVRSVEAGQLFAWQSKDFEHPVTALWNDPAQGNLGSVRVGQYFPLTLKEKGAAPAGTATAGSKPSVIVRLSNGDPAAAEWNFGSGRVVVFDSTATPEWNNLPLNRAFVALMQRLMGYLNRADQSRLVLSPGEPFVMSVSPEWRGRDFSVMPPGKDAVARVSGQVTFDEGKAYIRFANTENVGAYKIIVDQEPVAAFAVQLNPKESDLRQITPQTLEGLSKPPPAPVGEKAAPPNLVVKKEFWTLLVWIALIAAILETGLAYRFSQSR